MCQRLDKPHGIHLTNEAITEHEGITINEGGVVVKETQTIRFENTTLARNAIPVSATLQSQIGEMLAANFDAQLHRVCKITQHSNLFCSTFNTARERRTETNLFNNAMYLHILLIDRKMINPEEYVRCLIPEKDGTREVSCIPDGCGCESCGHISSLERQFLSL